MFESFAATVRRFGDSVRRFVCGFRLVLILLILCAEKKNINRSKDPLDVFDAFNHVALKHRSKIQGLNLRPQNIVLLISIDLLLIDFKECDF